MNTLMLEALVAGLYCAALSPLLGSYPFVLGFTKHVLGYLVGSQTWFCSELVPRPTFLECALEGLGVSGFTYLLGTSAVAYFFIGIMLQFAAQFVGFRCMVM